MRAISLAAPCGVTRTRRDVSAAGKFVTHRRRRSYLVPSEAGLIVQTILVGVVSAWWLGGVTLAAQDWIFGLIVLGLTLLLLRREETRTWPVRPLLPALLWLAFVLIALANPSHTPAPRGGWIERGDWLRWLPTTADREHTLVDLRFWLAALLQGGLFVALDPSPRVIRRIWAGLALNGAALAILGACFHFAGSERMLGWIDTPEPTYFFATFFYKNHWAAFGALAAAASFSLALGRIEGALAGDPEARGHALLFGATGLLTAVTLPLPGSRAGALFTIVLIGGFFLAVAACAWRARARRSAGRRWLAAGGAVIAAAIVAFGVVSNLPRARLDFERTQRQLTRGIDGESPDLRLQVSRDTWRMAAARPWFGWGPGCFEVVFPIFQGNYLRHPDGRTTARFEFAHNDWLQCLAELGVLGSALLLAPAALVAWRAWRGAGMAGRCALGGCALVAAHAWIDFPLHNPAVLILWVTLLATAHRLTGDDEDDQASFSR